MGVKSGIGVTLFVLSFLVSLPAIYADEEDVTRDSAPKSVGGLLFDFDEGVEIKQKPGTALVEIGSNKEYIKKKFRALERRMDSLEERLHNLEAGKYPAEDEAKTDVKAQSTPGVTADGKRVLST